MDLLTNQSGVQPGQIAELEIEGLSHIPQLECYLEVIFTLREATSWAEAGHEIAFGQINLVRAHPFQVLKGMESPKDTASGPKYSQTSPQEVEIVASTGTVWKFNVAHGNLVSCRKAGLPELIHTSPVMDFYRALTDNDRPQDGVGWLTSRLHQTKSHVRSVTWSGNDSNVTVIVTSRIAPAVLEWCVDTTFTYTFTNSGLFIKVAGVPRGENTPPNFARIGLTLSLNSIDRATWFGRGPGESYCDKKLSQRMGNWSAAIEDLYTDYEFPQESGNRTDVRWVGFKGPRGELKAYFGDQEGCSFSALHYETKDLDDCTHPYELYKRKKDETIVRLDWAHHGLGTGSCGPKTLPKYELRSGPFEFEILLV